MNKKTPFHEEIFAISRSQASFDANPKPFLESFEYKKSWSAEVVLEDAVAASLGNPPQTDDKRPIRDPEFYANLWKLRLSYPQSEIGHDKEMILGLITEESINTEDVFDDDYNAIHVLLTEKYRVASIKHASEFILRVKSGGRCSLACKY